MSDSPPRILALAGSTRAGSYNKLLARIAAGGARRAGAEVRVVDLADYPLPLFDEDLEREEGIPENALALKRALRASQGFLVASPEYNSSITGVLKNAIDWVSRKESRDEPWKAAFDGKAAALMSASPGALGGLRGLVHLRSILGNLGVLVLPQQKAIPLADSAFAEDGSLRDVEQQRAVEDLGARLAGVVRKLAGGET